MQPEISWGYCGGVKARLALLFSGPQLPRDRDVIRMQLAPGDFIALRMLAMECVTDGEDPSGTSMLQEPTPTVQPFLSPPSYARYIGGDICRYKLKILTTDPTIG